MYLDVEDFLVPTPTGPGKLLAARLKIYHGRGGPDGSGGLGMLRGGV